MKEFLASGRAQNAFVISPSYLVAGPDVEAFANKPELRGVFDAKTARLISGHPDRLIGVCGLNQHWEDGHHALQECLKFPGMLGVKLRFGDDDLLSASAALSNVQRALAANSEALRFVLIHMPGKFPIAFQSPRGYNAKQRKEVLRKDVLELEALASLARAFPSIRFVVAHSLNAWEPVQELARIVERDQLENLWLETSFALNQFIPDDEKAPSKRDSWKQFVAAWRKFGINKILFGSDQVIGQSEHVRSGYDSGWRFDDQLKYLQQNPFLTGEERAGILRHNGEAFVRALACPKSTTVKGCD